MTSHIQVEANRRNAQKSTGPRTPEGKAVVRYNALKHGFRARTVLAPGENFEEYDEFRQGFYDQWKPANPTETAFVEQVATAFWRLDRVRRIEAEMMEDDIERCRERWNNPAPTLGFAMARDLAAYNTYYKLGL